MPKPSAIIPSKPIDLDTYDWNGLAPVAFVDEPKGCTMASLPDGVPCRSVEITFFTHGSRLYCTHVTKFTPHWCRIDMRAYATECKGHCS